MDHLIFVRKAYIPNFRPLVPFLHVKKFVVVGGGWVVVVEADFIVKLEPQAEQCWMEKFTGCRTFWYLAYQYKNLRFINLKSLIP